MLVFLISLFISNLSLTVHFGFYSLDVRSGIACRPIPQRFRWPCGYCSIHWVSIRNSTPLWAPENREWSPELFASWLSFRLTFRRGPVIFSRCLPSKLLIRLVYYIAFKYLFVSPFTCTFYTFCITFLHVPFTRFLPAQNEYKTGFCQAKATWPVGLGAALAHRTIKAARLHFLSAKNPASKPIIPPREPPYDNPGQAIKSTPPTPVIITAWC